MVTDRWQTFTNTELLLCSRIWQDAVMSSVISLMWKGLCRGIDMRLVNVWVSGVYSSYLCRRVRSLEDLSVERLGRQVDLTIGSALDIFGGKGVLYEDVLRFNHENQAPKSQVVCLKDVPLQEMNDGCWIINHGGWCPTPLFV